MGSVHPEPWLLAERSQQSKKKPGRKRAAQKINHPVHGPLFGVKEAAKYMGICSKSFYYSVDKHIKRTVIKGLDRVLYAKSELDRYIAECQQK